MVDTWALTSLPGLAYHDIGAYVDIKNLQGAFGKLQELSMHSRMLGVPSTSIVHTQAPKSEYGTAAPFRPKAAVLGCRTTDS